MHPAQVMYRLQEIDDKTAAAEQRLAEVKAQLGESEAVVQARSEVETTEKELRSWSTVLRDQELEVQRVNGRIESSKERLYGGKVRNPKELKSLEEELQSFQRWRSTVEDKVLEAMLRTEELQEDLSAKQATLDALNSDWQESQRGLLQELTELTERLSLLSGKRQERAAAVGDNITIYDDLYRRRAGRAVALLRDGMCRACGMSLPTGEVQRITYTQELCRCPNCGRILWAA
jgi:predicted  nucleic acid-binding Zn-ribbon protein